VGMPNYTNEQVITASEFIKPYINQAIKIVEDTDKTKPGEIKKQAAIMILNGILYLLGQRFNPTPEIRRLIEGVIGFLIDQAVALFNKLFIFTKGNKQGVPA